MISVYDKTNENYTGNGTTVLRPKECKIRMIAGGNYDLTMTHMIDPEGKWQQIQPGAIIKAPVPEEEIDNARAGYAADVYKTTTKADLREGPMEPTAISYPAWNINNNYAVGAKVSNGGKNWQCTFFDETSAWANIAPPSCSWWKSIPTSTAGAAVLITLQQGEELYLVEDVDSTWYKMQTYYGVEGYIKKSQVTYDRHLTPSETTPRIIKEQLFRIEKPVVDTKNGTVTVTAKHVSYDLAGVLVRDVNISQATPAMALGRIVEGFMMDYRGTIATNLSDTTAGTYTGEIKGKNGIYALLDPDKGIVSQFDAAFRRDNWDLFVMKKVVKNRGFRIQYRKNLLGVNWSQDISGLITRVVPVAKDEGGNDLYLPGNSPWVDSSLINNYPVIRMERLTVKGQVGKDKGLGDDSVWTEEDLLAEMRTKAAERFSVDKVDQIVEEITVDFEQLGDTDEYSALKGLEKAVLYDTVTVVDDRIGLTRQLQVTEIEWDAIRKKISAMKLANVSVKGGKNVTGYNVQARSIGIDKLSDDVASEILSQVNGIVPEYAQPYLQTTHANTKDQDGYVTKGSGNANKVWKTDGDGVPAWRDDASGSVTDGDPTLAWGTRSTVGTVNGTDLHVTMPANPDTWRDVVDNLNSTSTSKSLTANQGSVLNNIKVGHTDKTMSGVSMDYIQHAGIVAILTDRGNLFVDGINGRTLMKLGPGTGIKCYRSTTQNDLLYITAANSSRYTVWSGSAVECVNVSTYRGAYSDQVTFLVDDIVTQDSKLYKCTTAITTAEEWNPDHWALIAE